jgi:hypothetical protein
MNTKSISTINLSIIFALLCFFTATNAVGASQIDIAGPAGSGIFGTTVTVLPNGNIVVTDQQYNAPGPVAFVGAVYLYNGTTGALISTLTGSTANNFVGSGGIVVLANGNFVVRSPSWDAGAPADVGAVTWCSGTTGCSGTVSAANSLIGSTANDNVGSSGVTPLPNGNYIVSSQSWDNPGVSDAGAVTFGDGSVGTVGAVSATNSLVGSTAFDTIGSGGIFVLTNGNYVVSSWRWSNTSAQSQAGAATWGSGTTGVSGTISAANSLVGLKSSDNVGAGITVLTNGNYVVGSSSWDNGAIANVGAATWGNGTTGVSGTISAANSLTGSVSNDNVAGFGIVALSNGNYVVASSNWDNGAVSGVGAVTWCNGSTGTVGPVSPANSLIGSVTDDTVGWNGVVALTNGNYVVKSANWNNGAAADVGAVTWGNGSGGTVGTVSAANSLIGSTANDLVGFGAVTALTNGNYVVGSSSWNNGAVVDAGAITWGNGAVGAVGTISAANSLVGSTANDQVGNFPVAALSNGNYVVRSNFWDNGGVLDAGAVTWGSGAGGTVGAISAANSLVGSTAGDQVGAHGITALTNGNYVVSSQSWNNSGISGAGAVTWGNGNGGTVGAITSANSLVGSTAGDQIGFDGITALPNGSYVVRSQIWDNGAIVNAGAATWGNGSGGTVGTISAANSLIGSTANDLVGSSGITVLSNGNYVVRSINWDNGATVNAGAFSYGAAYGGTVGTITGENSVRGTVANGGNAISFSIGAYNEALVVGRRSSNMVSILNPTYTSVADGNWSAGATWNYGAFDKSHDVYIPNGRTVNLDVIDTISSLRVDCTGALTGAGATAYIVGNIRKDFCSAGAFSYPVGTVNGYSPVNGNVTALGTNPSSLTISATQNAHTVLDASNSLKRFWTLTESGDLTTDLTFNYLDPLDISGSEASYKLYRVTGGVPMQVTPFVLDAGANTISTTGVSTFSDWAVGSVVPSAANASVSGRVMTSDGSGIRGVIVSLTDADGITRIAKTGTFGYYRFDDVSAGETYTVSVAAKKFTFANPTQIITVKDNIADLDFTAE